MMEKFKDFKKYELKLEKILQKGKRFNLIDRFYYYSIKKNQIKSQISKLEITEDEYHEFLYFLLIDFESREHELKSAILESDGLSGIKAYSDTKKATILSNPDLLGISPFLFRINTNEWYDYLKNDIAKYENFNIYHIQQIILNCLNESLNRLDLKYFTTVSIDGRKLVNMSSDDLFFLLVDDIFEVIENSGLNENSEKEKDKFLKSEMQKKSIKSKLEINLPFEKADKVFQKYFEINLTNDRYNIIYPSFRDFLKVIYNKASIETDFKNVAFNAEEIKKMIGFFGFYKTAQTSSNIFTYKRDELIELFEQISGLEAKKEAWRQAHKPSVYKIDKGLEREINSIIS